MAVTRRTVLKGIAAAGAGAVAGALPAPARAEKRKEPPPDAVGMLYDATRCIGCKACVVKCKEANGLPADDSSPMGPMYDAPYDLNATTKNVIKLYKGADGRTSYVKAQCMHCVDPACASVCMISALHKGARGIVEYDKDKCVGCRYCQIACPFNVPKFEWNAAFPQIVKCEMCRHLQARGEIPACCRVCPREAVVFGRLDDLRTDAMRRMAAFPGRYYPRVFGDKEIGGTQVLYLSAAGIPFESLGFPALGEEPVPALSEKLQHAIYQGFIAPAVLYAALGVVMVRNRRKNGPAKDEEEAP